MKNNRTHLFMLFICSFLWGTTFVAQSLGADRLGPFTYLMGRSVLGFLFLIPVILILDKADARRGRVRAPQTPAQRRELYKAGFLCGTLLFAASTCQQIGIGTTTTAKAGFITALYVVLVPVLGIFLGRRPGGKIWVCVAVCVAGLYLLSMQGGFSLTMGDSWVLSCAPLFAFQIMAVEHYCTRVDAVRLSCAQFFTVTVWSGAFSLLLEQPTLGQIWDCILPIAYAGILSSGVAYTLQIVGQEGVEPPIASMVMSLESVFSALSGWLVLQESLTPREFTGCALMFGAILAAQLDLKALPFCRSKKQTAP